MRKEFTNFQLKYKAFMNNLKVMAEERNKREKWDAAFEMMYWRFYKTEIEPMEKAWEKLTPQEKDEVKIERMGGMA